MRKITGTTRQILISAMISALFLFGCTPISQSTGTLDNKIAAGGEKSLDQGNTSEDVALENVDKVVYLKRIYEKDGKNFLEFQDMKEYGNKLISLPLVRKITGHTFGHNQKCRRVALSDSLR